MINRYSSRPWMYYFSQILVSLLGLLVPALLLHYCGVEFFGVFAFSSVLQACLQVCDLGLSSAMTRACATCEGITQLAEQFPLVLRAERLIAMSSIFFSFVLVWPLSSIYPDWFGGTASDYFFINSVLFSMLMAIISRNQLEFYRGVLTGCQQLNWLAIEVLLFAIFRTCALLVILQWSRFTISVLFLMNLIFNLMEIFLCRHHAYSLINKGAIRLTQPSQARRLPWGFAFSMVSLSILWIIFSQLDKLYLSRLWTVDRFAEFSVATLLASGILIISIPVQNIVATRLASVFATGDADHLITCYREATHWLGLIIWPFCAVFLFKAEDVLRVWTGNTAMAERAAPVLIGYAIGNGLIAIGSVSFYLQFALGRLRLHLVGAMLFMIFMLPAMVWCAGRFGLAGAGAVWCGVNLLNFLIWLPYVHRQILAMPYNRWILQDVLPGCVCAFVAMSALSFFTISEDRLFALIQLGFCYGVCLLVTALVVDDSRRWILKFSQSSRL